MNTYFVTFQPLYDLAAARIRIDKDHFDKQAFRYMISNLIDLIDCTGKKSFTMYIQKNGKLCHTLKAHLFMGTLDVYMNNKLVKSYKM